MQKIIYIFILLFSLHAQSSEINLKCIGVGSKAKVMSSNDPNTGQTTTMAYKDESSATVNVFINNEKSWIQIPPHLLPPIKKKKENNKYEITNLEINENSITGKFELNFLNKPKVNIDRFTGILSFNGLGVSFSGECSKIDRSEKKF